MAPGLASSSSSSPVRFRFDKLDLDGPWSLLEITKEDHRELLEFLKNIESMTAGELFDGGGRLAKHYIDITRCPNPATPQRLADEYQGADSIHRLEIDGLKRLYGFRYGNEFSIIWWDPSHDVWPSKLKNT